jgi:hypothetical protein
MIYDDTVVDFGFAYIEDDRADDDADADAALDDDYEIDALTNARDARKRQAEEDSMTTFMCFALLISAVAQKRKSMGLPMIAPHIQAQIDATYGVQQLHAPILMPMAHVDFLD